MKITIDTDARSLVADGPEGTRTLDLWGKEAFELISDVWLRTSWNAKYPYTFTWLDRPIIQHPEDMVRTQEAICALRPDVIVETGVAHGGSLVFSAGLMKAMGFGRLVVGVDIEVRPHNRAAIEAHPLAPMIALVEGDSAAPEIVDAVRALIRPGESVLVILDSNHTKAHVARELEAYASLVTPGSYIVATDGIMREVADTPRGKPDWTHDNPAAAAEEFAARRADFALAPPAWRFNESDLDRPITAWPSAWLKRVG
ncbi:cephalosporin hydroxylase family protein [Salinarimonas ramus]|uniref:Hydroxylase n=1 Tax=Salinarimonas ramus TaxID=690164 RepID=A0A917Q6A9_9HYPH|nr:CmcI family methyltransferase [Salinarimonas ramus]GGK29291.1 hydroxylase [Salinarimonas ramus]